MPKPQVWVKIKTADGNAPSARLGHTLVEIDKDFYILYGGLDVNSRVEGNILPNGQVYTLRINQRGEYVWSLTECDGEEIPLARTNHAACKIGKNEMFVFGGYYTSKKRFNDVHILKTGTGKKYTWIQPANQKLSKTTPKNTASKIGAPEPRANHTCTFVPNTGNVYVFGGHGGVGYSRKSFNDIYAFNTVTQEWSMPIAHKGNVPKERGGHSACLLPDGNRILIYGGWSGITQYFNCYLFDTISEEWIDLDTPTDIPRWNHCAVVVPCLPESKMFVFGGERAHHEEGNARHFGKLENGVSYIELTKDLKGRKFKNAEIEDQPEIDRPLARENASLIYDRLDQKLLIFGGWSGTYLNDIWELNISKITGPDYSISGITPNVGPVTGGTYCEITGEGFTSNKLYKIQFSTGKPGQAPVEASARLITSADGPNRLVCETPSFMDLGKGDVEVRIIADRGDPTLDFKKFSFFMNITPKFTLAYGPGLLNFNSTAGPTCFYVQARNKNNENRTTGKDEILVNIFYEYEEKVPKGEGEEMETKIVKAQVHEDEIKDFDNGLYMITYTVDQPRTVTIDVQTKGEDNVFASIRGAPFEASFDADYPEAYNSFTNTTTYQYYKWRLYDIDSRHEATKEGISPADNSAGGAAYETDIKPLLKIKESILQIKEEKDQNLLELEVIKEALSNLYNNKIAQASEVDKANGLIGKTAKLYEKAEKVETTINPFVNKQKEKTKTDIENFEKLVKSFLAGLKQRRIFTYNTGYETALVDIKELQEEIMVYHQTLHDFDYYSSMLFDEEDRPGGLGAAHKHYENISTEIDVMKYLWEHIEKCEKKCADYINLEWKEVDPNYLGEEIKTTMSKPLKAMKKIDKKANNTYAEFAKKLQQWEAFMGLISELRKPSMSVDDDRHWSDVRNTLNDDFTIEDSLKLETFWNLDIYDRAHKEAIEEITLRADQERKIEKQLDEVDKKWRNVEFERFPLQLKEVNLEILKMNDDDMERLENDQLLIQNISGSKFMTHFADTVKFWQTGLAAINDTVSLLSEVQKTWSFLINLFRFSEEVKKELEQETKDFHEVDREVERLMTISKRKELSNVLNFCTQEYDDDNVLAKLNFVAKELAKCQKGLNNFIAQKRKVFPRFYFLTMEELLDILANGNNPIMLFKEKNYMNKVVQAADKLSMEEKGGARPTIISMNACVGKETVIFVQDEKATLTGKVEIYLQDILDIINKTLREGAKKAWKEFAATIMQEVAKEGEKASDTKLAWIKNNYAQLVLLVNATGWARSTEDKFRRIQEGETEAMGTFLKHVIANLTALIKLVQGELDSPTRRKVMCLITIETHNRDIIEKLVKEKVRKADDFQWQSQLKFYYDDKNEYFYCRIADAMLKYSYEYLGNGARLVVTPLTDRIYVTATQALHLKMGCAPAGPAGTGKTETTKDLASAVAKACYVFNCSPEMDYQSMGNIFKGLASSGCWGCFDEFNRLIPEVLSVCTVQFKAVTDAIKAQRETFRMGEDEIKLDPTCGAFITMNPGYLGRAELPEGLKALFRPITVVVPDLELICENILMAEGFVTAKILARKFVTLYKLCRDLLSKQLHYDWGLRAIKSVLVVAGSFKRGEPDIPEGDLLFRALRDFNYPKIAQVDLNIFDGLLGDLFPGLNPPRKRDMKFEEIIIEVSKKDNFELHPEFIKKVVQLGELLEIRHCVFVMGPPGSGKSTTWKTLAKANTAAGNKTTIQDLDPKTISTNELYGYTNQTTKEWKNGLLSHYMQTFSEELTDGKPKWIILDGDLDANWIESMNSVMDDNKLLTLANNGRIVVKDYMKLLFEIKDLKYATPATVSRAGILYISDDSGYQIDCYLKAWLRKQKYEANMEEALKRLIEKYITTITAYLYKKCKFVTPVSFFGMTVSFCKLMQSQVKIHMKHLYPVEEKDNPKSINLIKLEHIFALSGVWAYGGSLTIKDTKDYRKEFSDWWKGEFNKPVKFKPKGTVFDYFVKMDENKAEFEEWKIFLNKEKEGEKADKPPQVNAAQTTDTTPNPFDNVLASVEYDGSVPMQNITVPIPETVSIKLITKSLIYEGHPTLMIGNAGSGKTQLIKGILKEVRSASKPPNEYYFTTINFNYYTNASYLQTMLEQDLVKQGTRYGPKKGSQIKLIYFIDDLNMPLLDTYNTQTAIALLRQHIDHSHWYDVSKQTPILKEITNTLVISAMNPTSGSFFVNPRYMRHFWTCAIGFPEPSSLGIIYETFLKGHFSKFKTSIQELIPQLIKGALTLHDKVCSSFRKTAINFHYEFNIRHISNIFSGILQTEPSNFTDTEKIIKLWFHESERIYADRLVVQSDIKTYTDLSQEVVKKVFGKNVVQKHYSGDNVEPLIFCHFPKGYQGDEVYDLTPFKIVEKNISEALEDHNGEKVSMDLVLFEDAVKHVCRITRIITNTAGHALLVGVGGSGRQSLSKLSAYIKSYTVFSITVSKEYSMIDLKNDLIELYNKTGIKDDPYMFLITDSHITHEAFLVYINDLLSSGEIADLFTEDEKINITNTLASKYRGLSQDEIYGCFIDKVREKLHVVLCFSPVGDSFRTRARRFPALVNSTVIDWFQPWPEKALEDVSSKFLAEIELGSKEIKSQVVKFMPHSFTAVNKAAKEVMERERRYIYNTPKSFLELIKLYTNMLGSKRRALQDDKDNYEKGLKKLIKTKEEVGELDKNLKVMQAEVEIIKKEADEKAESVGQEKEIVEEENRKATIQRDNCASIKAKVEKDQISCQTDVDKLQPMVEIALMKVRDINETDIKTVRGYNAPPAGIDKVLNCIQFMFAGVPGYTDSIELNKQKLPKNLEWGGAKKEILTKADVLISNLKSFPEEVAKGRVPDQNFREVAKLFSDPEFTEALILGKSKAAASMYSFVVNMRSYYEAMKEMIPKQNALEEAKITLEEKVQELKVVEEKVAELNKKLAVTQKALDEAIAKKDAAQQKADACNKKLSLATRLVSALDSEEKRWGTSIEELTEKLNVLVGDVLIAAAFISYAGPFSKTFRTKLVQNDFKAWVMKKGIPVSKNIDPVSLLVSEAQIAEWNNEKLPSDDVSVENATILTNSERYPLMIDPQLQGIVWIKQRFTKKDENADGGEENELMILKLSKRTYALDLERAIEDGQPVLIENLQEYIDPVLMPVIARNVIKKGNKRTLIFGGKPLDLHPNFRLYMQSKMSNPDYPPEIQAEAVLINFTVTEIGLGDQLLNFIVGKERPDLAKKKEELVVEQNKYKIQLKDLERGLLDKLNKTVGDPTENIELIEGLEYSKLLATEIKEKVTIAEETTKKINETSEFYRQAATRGSLIFFLMNNLNKSSSFYKYSLESFINVIDRSINIVANKSIEDKRKAREQVHKEKSEVKLVEPQLEEGSKAKSGGQAEGDKSVEIVTEVKKETSELKIDTNLEELNHRKPEVEEPLTPRSLRKRVIELTESITYCSFNFVRRGLFEKHKLIFTAMLCFRIMISTGELSMDDYQNFIITKKPANVNYPENENIKSYINETQYKECKGLEYIDKFQGICDSLLSEHIIWKTWISKEKVEDEELPSKVFSGVTAFQKLMLIKILRPDRVSYALRAFLINTMGEQYINQPAFKFKEIYLESNERSPIFFVLFPGVDPTPAVEEHFEHVKKSSGGNLTFTNISMGQGQEEGAKLEIERCAKQGGWLFLQNVHLMQAWLRELELKLEEVSATANKDFRLFISSEPPPPVPGDQNIVPEAILQRCLKVANEAPSDLKANMRRAYSYFNQEKIERSSKKNEYKSILFALCYFHSVVSGRKKFGNQGWSRVYNFNDGDLTICADVLHNYLEKYEVVPYSDLIYIYGEIMYGGHITDDWDRRTNNTYLKKLISPKLLNCENLLPVENKVFRMLDPSKSNYEDYNQYIEKLPDESPLMFGMNPNAEINFLMNQTEFIFKSIIELIGESGSGGSKSDSGLKEQVARYKKDTEPQTFDLIAIKDIIKAHNKSDDMTPFQIVCLQECERMNEMTTVMVTSLVELELGLDGALNMTDAMDALAQAITLNRVYSSWGEFYMSRKPLDSWFSDFKRRCDQLREWSGEKMTLPKPLRLSYLFNPMSFLTAIMQITSRENGLPLDNMALVTKITTFKDAAELQAFEKKPPPEKKNDEEEDPDLKKKDEGGAYVDGFFLEGADWEASGSGEGYLTDQKLKVLHPILPIVKVIAVPIEQKSMRGQYPCPVYYTTMRGPTFVFTANLTMESEDEVEEWKWILLGVAAILNDDN